MEVVVVRMGTGQRYDLVAKGREVQANQRKDKNDTHDCDYSILLPAPEALARKRVQDLPNLETDGAVSRAYSGNGPTSGRA